MKMYRCILLFLLSIAAAMVHAQCKRALVFGIGEYEDKSWNKINGDKDVDYAVEMLKVMGYTDIVTFKNSEATKVAMVEAFVSLAKRCGEGDVVYIHYSGHGQMITDLNGDESFKWSGKHAMWDESWVPYDAYMMYGKNDDGSKHLTDDEVASFLTAIRESIGNDGELVVVVDACHSGDATCGENDAPVRGIGVKFNIPRSGNVEAVQPAEELWQTISACKPYQLNMEMGDPQVGKLTYALFLMGTGAFDMDNETLQEKLAGFMEEHKGPLPQMPVVSGVKKISK